MKTTDQRHGRMVKNIINFAPTGMIPTKEMTPHVPISVSQIVENVHEAWEVGITMVHLHAREKSNGAPSYRAEIYRKIIEGVRDFSDDLIICVSLSGRKFKNYEKRTEPLQLEGAEKPDMGSLTLGSLNFKDEASLNSPDMIHKIASEMINRGILAELEAFDLGMINYAKFLEKKGLLRAPHYFNLILGNIACAQPDLLHISALLKDLPSHSYWSLAGIGDCQKMVNSLAIACGGGVRVGLEDNIWYDNTRQCLARNVDLIKRIHAIAAANEQMVMSPEELRKGLHLCAGGGEYGRRYD
jgi:uncharacterized protein (DUF849 family)